MIGKEEKRESEVWASGGGDGGERGLIWVGESGLDQSHSLKVSHPLPRIQPPLPDSQRA
jgi:hypothetical protein